MQQNTRNTCQIWKIQLLMAVGQQLQNQLIYFCSWWENDNGFGNQPTI